MVFWLRKSKPAQPILRKPFHLSEVYRARRRDAAVALAALEDKIRAALADAFAAQTRSH